MPLALCDGSTVPEDSLIECTHINQSGEEAYNQYITYSSKLRWYYLSHQTMDEVLLFKHYDSANVEARSCPHASFRHSFVPVDCHPRESMETKVFIFTNPESSRP
jgi:hypothetical protein